MLCIIELASVDILKKRPRPGDIATLLGHFAHKWKDIGENLGVSSDTLQNLEVISRPDTTKLIWMTHKVDNLSWASLYTGVYNVNESEAEKMKERVKTDPTIFSNYRDN